MLHLERSLCGFSDAPADGLLGKALPTTATCTIVGFPVCGPSSHTPLSCSSYLKLSVCRTEDGLRALRIRAFTQENLREAEPISFFKTEIAPKEVHSVLDAFEGSHGGLDSCKDDDGNGVHAPALPISQRTHLRLDALDMEKDFRRRRVRPRLDVDTPVPQLHAKPGKRQDVPRKAKQMILELRELCSEDFAPSLKRFTAFKPDRADWLYVLRYFKEKEDKSMLIQVFNFVLLEPAFMATARDYTNLMLVHVQLKNHEAAEHTLKAMVEKEVFPDLVTFTVLIGMYGNLGNLDMVIEKFSELKSWGLVPDTLVYCALIEAYSQLGHAREAEMFLRDMELSGLPLKIEIFISLIRGYGNIGQVKDAERIFQLMQAMLFYPERRSYSALMDVYAKDEDLTHAIQVFNNMLAVGIEPTDKALARLLSACKNKNMLREATEIMERIESKSFKFGTKALVIFNGWLQKLGLDTEVKQVSLEVEKRLCRKAYLEKKLGTGAYLPNSSNSRRNLIPIQEACRLQEVHFNTAPY